MERADDRVQMLGGAQGERAPSEATSWQAELKRAFRSAKELAEYLELPAGWAEQASAAAGEFPLLAPRPYVNRMRRGDPDDPLLRQVLPVREETEVTVGFSRDPLGELARQPSPGVIHKYQNRALLIVNGACAVHCRYCFRRHFPYHEAPSSPTSWRPLLDELAADASIDELILSGGDPLMLRDASLELLLRELVGLPGLRRLRIHTRLPVVIPQRVTAEFLEMLRHCRLPVVIVLHMNHARELDAALSAQIARLRSTGAMLFNQAVLLKGVNDRLDTLVDLSERLIDVGVVPYYLHQLDRVAGAAHFEVPETVGRELMQGLRARLPGYAVPRYVRDQPGTLFKLPLDGN